MKNLKQVGLLSSLALLVGSAYAEEFKPGFYVVGAAGQTTFYSSVNSNVSLASNAYLFSLGYELTPSIALEGGYGNLFTYNYTYSSSYYIKDTLDAYTFAAVYKPFPGKITPLFSVGTLSGTETLKANYGSGTWSYSKTTYGVGLEVPLDERAGFRLNYLTASDNTATLITAGVAFRF